MVCSQTYFKHINKWEIKERLKKNQRVVDLSEFLNKIDQVGKIKLIEPQSKIPSELGHPIRILMEEHAALIRAVDKAKELAVSLKGKEAGAETSETVVRLHNIAEHLMASENHYVREENVLFPYIEKHGITGPTAAMWVEHEAIRDAKKNYRALFDNFDEFNIDAFADKVSEVSDYLLEMLANHFYKENNVLFQIALQHIKEDEWPEIRSEFDELGYCCFTPEMPEVKVQPRGVTTEAVQAEGRVNFETGYFTPRELEALLNTIPLEITFVDADDKVRYFNRSKERLFVRTKATLGRRVEQCHPQRSLHLVREIVEDFRHGRRDEAEFWIQMSGRFIHIRFFPVRDAQGNYLGTVEVVQDITDIRSLEGEKRLL